MAMDECFDHVVRGHWQEHSGCSLYDSCQKVAKLGSFRKSLIYMHAFDTRDDGVCGSANDITAARCM